MILITGATGLVGSHLILELLNQNSEIKIKALYRSTSKKKKITDWLLYKNPKLAIENIIWEQADITNIPELENTFVDVTTVYHCAGMVNFDSKHKNELNKVNIEGTANVVNLALAFNIKKLCYVSSIATLGDSKNRNSTDESCEWNPEKYNGDYAISKNGGEIEVWRAMYEGLNAVIVNPGVIIGDGLWDGGSADMFNQVNNGLKFYTKGTTGFVAVTDVVNCMIKLMNSNITNQRYILVESSPTFQEILNAIAISINKKTPKIYANSFLIKCAWRFDALLSLVTGKKQIITKDVVLAAQSSTMYNNNKIKEAINYNFTPILDYIKSVGKEYLLFINKKAR